ncbi:MAG TPA: trehalose-6-phosphate synthase, partial [Dehalococcoidia bacterium]
MLAELELPQDVSRPCQGRLVLVSNRGPITHVEDERGRIQSRPTAGGVAVALNTVAQRQPVTWVAAASSARDSRLAQTKKRVPLCGGSFARFVSLPAAVNETFYSSFCNPLLWFVQHGLTSELTYRTRAEALSSWNAGYVPANQAFAAAAIEEIVRQGAGQVMLHDYHLYLAPQFIRARLPNCAIQHFVHIPWPAPQAWFGMPSCLVKDICAGLLACDSVSFQTERAVDN